MRRKGEPRRTSRLLTYVTPEEYEKVFREFKQTTCRDLSEFLRGRYMHQAETITYRNRSADDFLPVAIALKEQLENISAQLNNATKRLASARNTPEGRHAIDLLEAKLFLLGQATERGGYIFLNQENYNQIQLLGIFE